MRRLWLIFPPTIFAIGCSSSPRTVVTGPPPIPAVSPDSALLARLPTTDSTTDAEILETLRNLEYRSLAPGGEHIRGTLDATSAGALADADWPAGLHGAASSLAPSYDIDIESFSSHRRVQYFIDFFIGPARPRFNVWLGRLNRYGGMIRSVFRTHGVPEDLLFLGLIESGYSNTAVSVSRAVGMWQFMWRTGRAYGLRVDDWVDERRDPFEATDAAARYLSDLNERFGSWYLAAAAYNGGAGRISRGLRRLRDTSLSDQTFFELSERRYLRRETRDYVPKLIAATMIARDPTHYGFDSIPLLQPLVFDEVAVPDATGLDVIARLADTTSGSIVALNPRFFRGVTPPGERSVVRVPRGAGQLVAQRYEDLPAAERVNFLEHRIRRGETLGGLSQRYDLNVRLLMSANPGIQPRRLRIGQRIVVPVSEAARRGEVRLLPGARTSPTAAGVRRHRVVRGESLWLISRRYGVTVQDLRRWNDIRVGQVLRVGQRLIVGWGGRVHTVRRGDTLWIIAQRYQVATDNLRRWNNLAVGTILRVGQRLIVVPPGDG